MPEYTLATLLTMLVVVLLELVWFRTGIFRRVQYWISLLIMFSFQVPVDGWLTKLSDPIVMYNPDTMLNVRFPWDIPIEDFGFGFAMLTLTLMVWLAAKPSGPAADADAATHHPTLLTRARKATN